MSGFRLREGVRIHAGACGGSDRAASYGDKGFLKVDARHPASILTIEF